MQNACLGVIQHLAKHPSVVHAWLGYYPSQAIPDHPRPLVCPQKGPKVSLTPHFLPLLCLHTASTLSNGGMNLHSSVKRKLVEEKGYVFDKRLRYNIRQNESNCRFRDIVVRKEEGFTHVLLSSQTSDNNALTPEVGCWCLGCRKLL